MAGFCKHCGKELKDDEPYCPECGMPTESAFTPQPAYAPKKSGNGAAIAIIAVIVVISISMIALIPFFIDSGTSEKYTVTVKVESISVTVADSSYFGPKVEAYLDFTCNGGKVAHNFGPWGFVDTDGTEYHPIKDNTLTLSVTGDLKEVNYVAFLCIKKMGPGTEDRLYDYADLYDVSSKVTSPVTDPVYYGCSGVTFEVDNYDGSVVTYKGDSDPIGCIKLSFTAVKNQ